MAFAYEEVVNAIVVFLAAVGGVTAVLTLGEKYRTLRKPHDQRINKLAEHEQKLLHDYTELEEHEQRLCKMERDVCEVLSQNRLMIKAVKTLLKHCIDGNDIAALRVEYGILDRYLSGELGELAHEHP